MEDITFALSFFWEKLPLIILFTSAFFVSRLLVVKELTDYFVVYFLKKSNGHVTTLFLYVIFSAGIVSLFIPNMVAVLTLLPIIKTIQEDFDKLEVKGFCPTTVLTLLIIYGSNIGGLGSITGSPASLLLLGALELHNVPGRENINFLNWLIWGLPLAFVFILTAWFILMKLAVPKELKNSTIHFELLQNKLNLSECQRFALRVFLFFFLFWVVDSFISSVSSDWKIFEPIVAIIFLVIFSYLSFGKKNEDGKVLMKISDIFNGLPLRGFLFVIALVFFIVVIREFGIDRMIVEVLKEFIGHFRWNVWLFFLFLTLVVIFLTEFLSNTIVSLAFFSVAYYSAESLGVNPIPLMMTVALASTCAFMTPIATPANALAYGEMRGTSLKRMMLYGFILNIAGALLFTFWLNLIIPHLYY
ncbi:MAG: sodium:sulfate symporter [Nitrospinae bacterium]|nr:sodium:sulfate symporter [Nitrospinota bacterium]